MTAATFYIGMAATAKSLLARYGTTVTLHRVTGETFDPVTGATVAGSDASVTTTGVLLKYAENAIDGVSIMAGDRKLVLSNEQEPLPSDNPVIGGENWSIVSIDPVKPDDATPVVYFVQVRR